MIEPHSAQLGASPWTRKAAGPAAPRFIVIGFAAEPLAWPFPVAVAVGQDFYHGQRHGDGRGDGACRRWGLPPLMRPLWPPERLGPPRLTARGVPTRWPRTSRWPGRSGRRRARPRNQEPRRRNQRGRGRSSRPLGKCAECHGRRRTPRRRLRLPGVRSPPRRTRNRRRQKTSRLPTRSSGPRGRGPAGRRPQGTVSPATGRCSPRWTWRWGFPGWL